MASLADIHVPRGVGTFGVYSRRVVDAVISIPDRNFVFPALVQWVGLPLRLVPLRRAEKRGGHSSYNLARRIKLAARAIVWNSNKVLHLSAWVGLVLSVIALGFAAYLVVNYFITGASIPGWTSLMVIVLFVGGLILSSNGIMGVYLGAVFDSSKHRPRHVVADRLGSDGR
jgi:dolichol-phosphate mannosyltransferase